MTRTLMVKPLTPDVEKIPTSPAVDGDAGLDLCNAAGHIVKVGPYASSQIWAGIAVKIPEGYFGLIVARSSAFTKRGLCVVPSVIDEGYVGPLYVRCYNPCLDGRTRPVSILPWDRIAQMVLVPYRTPTVEIVDELPQTDRGDNGFGSTGT